MATHARDLPERTHPVLWLVGLIVIITILVSWFRHWYGVGSAEGRDLGAFPKPAPATPEPDHLALLSGFENAAVITRGETVYREQCKRCHGDNGDTNDTNMAPPPRNYHKDAFKWGSGRYQMYLTVTNGSPNGQMPGFKALVPAEDRYAVVHFIRETWMKKDNKDAYEKSDPPDVLSQIPKPGAAGDAGPKTPPYQRLVEVPVHPLMAGVAKSSAAEQDQIDAWLARASERAKNDATNANLVAEVAALDQLLVADLYSAAKEKNSQHLTNLLVAGTAGAFNPRFALTPESQLQALIKQLQAAAGVEAKSSSKGAK
jgi:mono/diheme cytochrome c family protein